MPGTCKELLLKCGGLAYDRLASPRGQKDDIINWGDFYTDVNGVCVRDGCILDWFRDGNVPVAPEADIQHRTDDRSFSCHNAINGNHRGKISFRSIWIDSWLHRWRTSYLIGGSNDLVKLWGRREIPRDTSRIWIVTVRSECKS